VPEHKIAVVDFDGTLAEYHGWQGPEYGEIGDPIHNAWNALNELHIWGWTINIHTTRGDHAPVIKWLKNHGFPWNAINSTQWNPEGCSSKPIGTVYFDDRDAHVVQCSPYDWKKAMSRVRRLYQPRPLDTYIDDAAIWAEPLTPIIEIIQKPYSEWFKWFLYLVCFGWLYRLIRRLVTWWVFK
jgi:hypothetical protein